MAELTLMRPKLEGEYYSEEQVRNMIERVKPEQRKEYRPLPTMTFFHRDSSRIRSIVGPVGSGKTSAAVIDIEMISMDLRIDFGIKETRWVCIRNTYLELMDTCFQTVVYWLAGGKWFDKRKAYRWEDKVNDKTIELMFRSCDRPGDVSKFKSMEITGYWIDEAIELTAELKLMILNRIGRYPSKELVRQVVLGGLPKDIESEFKRQGIKTLEKKVDFVTSCLHFGIETTNPPDVEDPMYSDFKWMTPQDYIDDDTGEPYVQGTSGPVLPDGPMPAYANKPGYAGFWQPPLENVPNLRKGYYDDLIVDYTNEPDWISMYVKGKPGIIVRGKSVYHNFNRDYHVAKQPLIWNGSKLYLGWDDSGNVPAAVVLQIVGPRSVQQLREYYSERMNIVDFGHYVIAQINRDFPTARMAHWGDPAGEAKFSKPKGGGFTSNATLLLEECGITVEPAENNLQARIEAVDQQLGRIDGYVCDPSCTRTINGFIGGYCYPENRAIMGEYLPNILKNRFSHLHDALQYVMMRLFMPAGRDDVEDSARRTSDDYRRARRDQKATQYNPLTFGTNRARRRRWRK